MTSFRSGQAGGHSVRAVADASMKSLWSRSPFLRYRGLAPSKTALTFCYWFSNEVITCCYSLELLSLQRSASIISLAVSRIRGCLESFILPSAQYHCSSLVSALASTISFDRLLMIMTCLHPQTPHSLLAQLLRLLYYHVRSLI